MSKKHFLFSGNETETERRAILVDNSAGTEQMDYTRDLSEDELIEAKEKFAASNLEIKAANAVLKVAKTLHKQTVKPLKIEAETLLDTIKTRSEEMHGTVYKMPDFVNGMMEFVNLEGEIVFTRRLKPDEKQGHMFAIPAKVAGE